MITNRAAQMPPNHPSEGNIMTTEQISVSAITNLHELIEAIDDARYFARVEGHTTETVYIEPTRIILERETLTDGSHVLNVRLVPVAAEAAPAPPQPAKRPADECLHPRGTIGTVYHDGAYYIGQRMTWHGRILKSWGKFGNKSDAVAALNRYYAQFEDEPPPVRNSLLDKNKDPADFVVQPWRDGSTICTVYYKGKRLDTWGDFTDHASAQAAINSHCKG